MLEKLKEMWETLNVEIWPEGNEEGAALAGGLAVIAVILTIISRVFL